MKRLLLILAVSVGVMVVAAATIVIPRFRNMESEYGTAQAIRDIMGYVQQHGGKWPGASSDLGGKYPVGGKVHVDYSMTSARLIESPALLRDAVRPRSGRFYTFPHYDVMISGLLATLRGTNQSEQGHQ